MGTSFKFAHNRLRFLKHIRGFCTLEEGSHYIEALAGKKESTENFEKEDFKKEPFGA